MQGDSNVGVVSGSTVSTRIDPVHTGDTDNDTDNVALDAAANVADAKNPEALLAPTAANETTVRIVVSVCSVKLFDPCWLS